VTKPTIGRVVWYRDVELSNQFCKADVVYVHNDTCVNLSVFDATGAHHQRSSVPFWQGAAEQCPQYSCCWMPYQQVQHAKQVAESGN